MSTPISPSRPTAKQAGPEIGFRTAHQHQERGTAENEARGGAGPSWLSAGKEIPDRRESEAQPRRTRLPSARLTKAADQRKGREPTGPGFANIHRDTWRTDAIRPPRGPWSNETPVRRVAPTSRRPAETSERPRCPTERRSPGIWTATSASTLSHLFVARDCTALCTLFEAVLHAKRLRLLRM